MNAQFAMLLQLASHWHIIWRDCGVWACYGAARRKRLAWVPVRVRLIGTHIACGARMVGACTCNALTHHLKEVQVSHSMDKLADTPPFRPTAAAQPVDIVG